MTESITTLPLIFWLLVVCAIAAVSYIKLKQVLSKKHVAILLALRAISLALVFILLLEPFTIIEKPDPDAVKTVVLFDCSGSMTTKDSVSGESRLDSVKKLTKRFKTETLIEGSNTNRAYIFSNEMHSLPMTELPMLPGTTAVGDVLTSVLKTKDEQKTAAVVLVSDGRSNAGTSLVSVAKQFKEKQIPINTIGVGSDKEVTDLAVITTGDVLSATKKKPVVIPFSIKNSFSSDKTVAVALYDDEVQVATQEVTVAANSTTSGKSFTVTPFEAGSKTYRVIIPALTGDAKPETNASFVSVDVKEPDQFSVLYLGTSLNWNYRFLNISASENKQVTVDAMIKLSENKFFVSPSLKEKFADIKTFPEEQPFYTEFDAIIIDSEAIATLEEKAHECLLNFVSNYGGGLLCLGAAPTGESKLAGIFPVKSSQPFTMYNKQWIQFANPELFPEETSSMLHDSNALAIPVGMESHMTSEMKRGARAAISFNDGADVLLATHRYGSGRTAFFGLDSTWKWFTLSDSSKQRYSTFWDHLTVWLGSTGKARTTIDFRGSREILNSTVDLSATIYDANFSATSSASVQMIVTSPSGEKAEYIMAPSADLQARYSAAFTPREAGEYNARIIAKFENDETITETAYFIVEPGGAELIDTAYNEKLLRDISRITGGTFTRYSSIKFPLTPNVSPDVPVITEKWNWSESWFIILLLLLALAAEWAYKRKTGLR